MPLPTMLTETSNNSVSAPQRDSPDVKAANKERQTIISTVPLVSCCYTEIVACMCKQSTPEKLHNKQFKAVVRNAETWRTRAYGGLDSNLLSSYGVWLPRFCLLRVCVCWKQRGREKGRVCVSASTCWDKTWPLSSSANSPHIHFMTPFWLWETYCEAEELFSSKTIIFRAKCKSMTLKV